MKIGSFIVLLLTVVPIGSPSQAPPSIEQALKLKGIDTSRSSLRKALMSKDVDIRGAAAMLLAIDNDTESIPEIKYALRKETLIQGRLNLARAFKTLGDSEGASSFVGICTNLSIPNNYRIMAADELSPKEQSGCFRSIIELLQTSDNPVEIQATFNYLLFSTEPLLSDADSAVLILGLKRALSHTVPSIRQAATATIVKYHLNSAKRMLEEAAAREESSAIKLQMKDAVSRLGS